MDNNILEAIESLSKEIKLVKTLVLNAQSDSNKRFDEIEKMVNQQNAKLDNIQEQTAFLSEFKTVVDQNFEIIGRNMTIIRDVGHQLCKLEIIK